MGHLPRAAGSGPHKKLTDAGRQRFKAQGSREYLSWFGLTDACIATETEFGLWECNLLAYRCFNANADQWRMSMGGPVGLDLTPVYHWLADQGITGTERTDLVADVQAIAAGALQSLAEQSEQQNRRR